MKPLSESDLMKRYGYYYDNLQKMGNMKYNVKPTIKSLGLSRATIQRAYKEMNQKGNAFMGGIIEYLEWISANHFFFMMRKVKPNQDKLYIRTETKLKYTIITFFEDFINLSRLYAKNPEYIRDLVIYPDKKYVAHLFELIEKLIRKLESGKIEKELDKSNYIEEIDVG